MTKADAGQRPINIKEETIRDAAGRIAAVVVRVGCAEAVLARAGAPGEIMMPAREQVLSSLAEISGELGGPLNRAYDIASRTFREAGFHVVEDPKREFLSCTRKDEPHPPSCDIAACPWTVPGVEYAGDECPLDRWRSMRLDH